MIVKFNYFTVSNFIKNNINAIFETKKPKTSEKDFLIM